jgi:RNA polymerase sporulation-specific sigma factor
VDILEVSDRNVYSPGPSTDEELALTARYDKSAENALVLRYLRLVCIKAQLCSGPAADCDDLRQEGLLGLLSAIAAFDPAKGVKFSTFAETCIVNRMYSFISKSRRNSSESLDTEITELLPAEETPESIYLSKEFYSELFNTIPEVLSETERKVFDLCLSGDSYKQTAQKLGMSVKAVDNAMQRVRRKLRKLL